MDFALELQQRIHHGRLGAMCPRQIHMSQASLEIIGLADRVAKLDGECAYWRDRYHAVEKLLNYKGPARRRYAHG